MVHLICDTIRQSLQACCDHTVTSAEVKDICPNTQIGRKFLILSSGKYHCLRSYTFGQMFHHFLLLLGFWWCWQQSIFGKVPQSNYMTENDNKALQFYRDLFVEDLCRGGNLSVQWECWPLMAGTVPLWGNFRFLQTASFHPLHLS